MGQRVLSSRNSTKMLSSVLWLQIVLVKTMSENFTCMLVLHFIELSSRGKQNVVNYVKQWHPTTVARRADSAV